MSGKTMDPERLAALYDLVPTTPPGFGLLHLSHADLRELLGDRDHQEAKAKRLESLLEKCDVSPEAVTMVLRPVIAALSASDWETVANETQDAMVAHLAERTRERDDARAEAKRWRSQCPVTAEHDTSAYTLDIGHALCLAAGLHRVGTTDTYETGPNGARVKLNYGPVRAINDLAFVTRRPAHDILDEMATATPGGDK